jgi:hypothetical protein
MIIKNSTRDVFVAMTPVVTAADESVRRWSIATRLIPALVTVVSGRTESPVTVA